MSQTGALNSLFEQWLQSMPVYGGNFSRDGIVDECSYNQSRCRCLFLLKEPNNHTDDIREHARLAIVGDQIRSYLTWRNLARWSHGLAHGCVRFDSIATCWEWNALASVAVMNLKKTPGGSVTRFRELAAFTRHEINKGFILKEISIIAPQIAICCGPTVWDLTYELTNPECSSKVGELGYFEWNGISFLKHNHPAFRKRTVTLYNPLMDAVRELLSART